MILDTDFPPDYRVEKEAVCLAEAGHEVHLFSLSYKGFRGVEKYRNFHIHRYPANKAIYKFSALAYTVSTYRRLVAGKIISFIRETGVEALHVHDMVIAKTVMEVNKKFKLPVVLDLHENRPVIMKGYAHLKRFPGKYLINLNRWNKAQFDLIRRCDRLVVVTGLAKDYYAGQLPGTAGKTSVVPNYVSLDFDQYKIDKTLVDKYAGSYNILYIGDTSLRRGTDTAVKSLRYLTDRIKNIKLILVGKSSEDGLLKKIIEDEGVGEYVDMPGWQDLEKLPSYIQAADICISPLERNLHHDTTYANKIFQYMILGKPIVVSDCPPQALVARDGQCGLAHKAGDPADLARQILKLHEDPGLTARYAENARKAVKEKYNWEDSCSALRRLYAGL